MSSKRSSSVLTTWNKDWKPSRPPRPFLARPEFLARLGRKDHQERTEPLGHLDPLDLRAALVRMDQAARLDLQALQDQQARKVRRDRQATAEQAVSAATPSKAPSNPQDRSGK